MYFVSIKVQKSSFLCFVHCHKADPYPLALIWSSKSQFSKSDSNMFITDNNNNNKKKEEGIYELIKNVGGFSGEESQKNRQLAEKYVSKSKRNAGKEEIWKKNDSPVFPYRKLHQTPLVTPDIPGYMTPPVTSDTPGLLSGDIYIYGNKWQ